MFVYNARGPAVASEVLLKIGDLERLFKVDLVKKQMIFLFFFRFYRTTLFAFFRNRFCNRFFFFTAGQGPFFFSFCSSKKNRKNAQKMTEK